MRLYSCSNESHTFTEVRWVTAKAVTSGILLGVIVLFGMVKLNQSVANANDSRSAETLAAENQVLRHQLSLMAPRISELEAQARSLDEHLNSGRTMFNHPEHVGDATPRFANAIRGSQSHSVLSSRQRIPFNLEESTAERVSSSNHSTERKENNALRR